MVADPGLCRGRVTYFEIMEEWRATQTLDNRRGGRQSSNSIYPFLRHVFICLRIDFVFNLICTIAHA